ncbi:hypothetical protein [Streptomyces sp. NPDC008125]|uniref:hypothetical protein n=1 Tax=Streptomyces sp. NPDC008125 TaxID=3364811 RepID=UPI0036E7589D
MTTPSRNSPDAASAEPLRRAGLFDPFLHQIVEVEQADAPDERVRRTGRVWPGLWLGPLLFSRAGVRVRAGAWHAAARQRGVADRSPLCRTFLRRYQPPVDLSRGWGSNAQWPTWFRLTTARSRADTSTRTAARTSTPQSTSTPPRHCRLRRKGVNRS